MNIMQIKCFWEVVKTQNVTLAAERLYLTQSAVSKKISSLEKELDIVLFERRNRNILPTPEGRELLESFGEILAAYEKTEKTVDIIRKSRGQFDGVVRMSLIPAVENLGVITAINNFSAINNSFKPVLEIAEENLIILSLQAGYCDVAFCSSLMLDKQLYCMEKYSTNRFKLVVSKNHRFAREKALRIKDLKNEYFVLLHPLSMLHGLCVKACEAEGFYPAVLLTTTRPEISLEYVRNYDCVYMSIDILKNLSEEIYHTIEIQDSPEFDYVFAWRKAEVPPLSVRSLVHFLCNPENLPQS